MKKMISASIALFVMEEPQVGPTVVMLILSAVVLGTPLDGTVVVVGADVVVDPAAPAAPALAVVVVALAVVVVVGLAVVEVVVVLGAWAAVTPRSAFRTLLLTASCWACDNRLMSD